MYKCFSEKLMFDLIDGFMPESSNLRDTSISRNKTLKSHDLKKSWFSLWFRWLRDKVQMYVWIHNRECQIHNAVTKQNVIWRFLWQLRQFWIHKSILLSRINNNLINPSKKTWTTDLSSTRQKWTEICEFSCYLQFKLAKNQVL